MPEANVKHQPHRLLLLFPGEIRPKLVESEAFLIGLIGISTLHCYDYNLMAIPCIDGTGESIRSLCNEHSSANNPCIA